MTKYYIVKISAETQEQADTILNSLLKQKLVTGGQFAQQPARFLWKGDLVDMNYITISSYTTEDHKDAIIEDITKTSIEEVPMVTFTEIDEMNTVLKAWIDSTLA